MKKKIIASLLVSLSVVGILPVSAQAAWKKDAYNNNVWVEAGGIKQGWNFIDNFWYYLGADGVPVTGWLQDKGDWYYMWSNGTMAYNTWMTKEFLDWMVESQTGQEALVKDMNMIPAFTNFKAESSNTLNKSITEYNNSGNTLKWAFTNFPDGFTMNDIGPVFSKFLNTDMGDAAKKEMLQNIQDASPKQAK